MDSYYTIVTITAIILLVGLLVFLGIKMSYESNQSIKFPSTTPNTCPDYWDGLITDEGKRVCEVPKNGKNMGILLQTQDDTNKLEEVRGYDAYTGTIDFGSNWTNCEKKEWALDNNVLWKGISEQANC